MAYRVVKEVGFAAAHRIPDHSGACRRLHGHNYKVRIHVEAEVLDDLGMVVDFAELKAAANEVAGRFDHRLINEVEPFDRRNPTAELLSEHIFAGVSGRLDDDRVKVRRVEVWENDASYAVYEP